MQDDAPWQRQPRESDRAWEAFQCYLGLSNGERSCSEVARRLKKTPNVILKWHALWDWKARVHAWEMHKDRTAKDAEIAAIKAAKEAEIKAISDMRMRHVNMSTGLTKLAGMDLQAWIYAMEQDRERAMLGGQKFPAPRLEPKDLRALMEAGIKLERISRGEPDSISEQHAQEIENAEKRQRLRPLVSDPRALGPLRALADALAETNPGMEPADKLIASITKRQPAPSGDD